MQEHLADYFGVTYEQILSYREYGDVIHVVINKGLQGCPKVVVSLEELGLCAAAEIEDDSQDNEVAIADTFAKAFSLTRIDGEPSEDIDYSALTVKELQDIAKERDISYAGLRKADLIEVLESVEW